MKVTIKENEQQVEPAIDWDKPQLVISQGGRVVITTGDHAGKIFSGTDLTYNLYSQDWTKSEYTPLPPSQSVILQND